MDRQAIATAIFVCSFLFGARPIHAQGPLWPKGIDHRMDLDWVGKAPARGAIFGRVADFDQYRLLVPDGVQVLGEDGSRVVSELIVAKSGKRELWFKAEAGKAYALACGTRGRRQLVGPAAR